jgi:predicted transcriptional regulator
MKQYNDKKSIYKVQALERALDILDCFSFQDRELSLTDVVQRTGLNKTTVKRLISNLTTRGYLQQDPQKKYQLGMRLFELGGIVFSSFSLRQAASYPMTRLQNEAGATVLLGVNMEDQLVYIDKREGQGMIRVSSEVGWRRPLNYGMLGMVLMSSLDSQDVGCKARFATISVKAIYPAVDYGYGCVQPSPGAGSRPGLRCGKRRSGRKRHRHCRSHPGLFPPGRCRPGDRTACRFTQPDR